MIKADDSGDSVKRGPSRTEYTLTKQGKNEFITLLESALKSNDFQLLAAGVAFMEMLPRQHVTSLFEERLVSLKEILTFLRSLPTEPIPSDPSKHPELIGMWVMSDAQTRQFVTLYQELQAFNDRIAQEKISCPRLCFAGTADKIDYGERWGNVHVDIAGPLINRRKEIEALGWEVKVLEGLDHTQAMQAANILPIIRPWLDSKLI